MKKRLVSRRFHRAPSYTIGRTRVQMFLLYFYEYFFPLSLSLSKNGVNLVVKKRGRNEYKFFVWWKRSNNSKKKKRTSFIDGMKRGNNVAYIFSSSMIYRNSRKLAKRQASGVSGIRGLNPTPNTLSRKNGWFIITVRNHGDFVPDNFPLLFI